MTDHTMCLTAPPQENVAEQSMVILSRYQPYKCLRLKLRGHWTEFFEHFTHCTKM